MSERDARFDNTKSFSLLNLGSMSFRLLTEHEQRHNPEIYIPRAHPIRTDTRVRAGSTQTPWKRTSRNEGWEG